MEIVDKHFKVMYQLETFGVKTDFHMLVMDEDIYSASISGPSLLTTVHWRMADIGRAISRMTSEATKLIVLTTVEITIEQALKDHLSICKKCASGLYCFPGNQLREKSE